MSKQHRVVIKLGTSSLTNGTKKLSRRSMLEFARQAALIHESGMQVVLVTSGAIASGREVLKNTKQDNSLTHKQMLAAVGQVHLMQIWTELFSLFDIPVGQVLLTRGDFTNRKSYLNVRDTLEALLHEKVIPIINENDTVATLEIKVGDNDNLSALAANLIAANLLVLLTDQQGLYDADPRINPDARLINVVEHIDESIFQLAGGSTTGLGTGGMFTKIQAAKLATQSGTPTVIASASTINVIQRLTEGEHIGTYFKAETTPHESRKRWLLSLKPEGDIVIDEGAEIRLSKQGASLLPVGITAANHAFERGALVQLLSKDRRPVAVGIANYSSQEIQKLIGTQSKKIEDCLGYTAGNEVVHRDNMAILPSMPKSNSNG
jgi:glutamate 5-kinase